MPDSGLTAPTAPDQLWFDPYRCPRTVAGPHSAQPELGGLLGRSSSSGTQWDDSSSPLMTHWLPEAITLEVLVMEVWSSHTSWNPQL